MTSLVIVGTGAHARKIYHYATALRLRVEAFLDDNPSATSLSPTIPCRPLNTIDSTTARSKFIVAIGDPRVRQTYQERLVKIGWLPIILVHPTAYVAPDAKIGPGVVICAQAVVETGSSIGAGTIIDVGAIVDHDSIVGDYCHLKAGTVLLPRAHLVNGVPS